jgi:hypothetical protein
MRISIVMMRTFSMIMITTWMMTMTWMIRRARAAEKGIAINA